MEPTANVVHAAIFGIMSSTLQQAIELGKHLSSAERAVVIAFWQELPDQPAATDEVHDWQKQIIDRELAQIARGEGESYTLDEAMHRIRTRRAA